MILIPEQIAYLRDERRKIKERLDNYKDYLSSRETTSSDYSVRGLIGDPLTEEQYHRERANYLEVTERLSGDYQKERPLDVIGVGTKFVIKFDGNNDKTETIILIDDIFEMVTEHKFVNVKSLLGQNVIGKKEDDIFEYEVPDRHNPREKRKITGKIVEVKRDSKDYLHFIREKKRNARMSKKTRREIHSLLTSTNQEDKKRYQQYFEITDSQKCLLSLEAERLIRQPKNSVTSNRLTKVKKFLTTSKIATPPTDGTIGIGTRFKIAMSSDGINAESREYEMINMAVSDELEKEYLERISPLGEKVYGLSENETFTIRENGKTYKGIVTSIDSPKANTNTQATPSYQYQKK